MFDFDPTRTYKTIEEKLAKTTNPRHRQMLTMLLQHARGEVEGDLEAVLGTLAPYPVYKDVRTTGPQPEGFEEVRDFYVNDIFGSGRHILESNKSRITVDDETIITEGTIRILLWGRDLIKMGAAVDDQDATYLMTADVLIVWPFDDQGRIIGEESWNHPVSKPLEKIAERDVPERFREYIAGQMNSI